jgi:hypothetical protein
MVGGLTSIAGSALNAYGNINRVSGTTQANNELLGNNFGVINSGGSIPQSVGFTPTYSYQPAMANLPATQPPAFYNYGDEYGG